jgi:hypothetical protein
MRLRACGSIPMVLVIVLGGAQSESLRANVIHVPTEQSSIQAAINASTNGDTVLVAPGTYIENINFSGKAITVISDQGPALTVIDGNNNGPVATFVSGEGPQSVLNGFTIQHGSAQFVPILSGGGVRIENSSPGIAGNVITSNNAGAAGGGIYILFGSPLIQSNQIINNGQASGSGGIGGGGMAIVGSTAQVLNNIISNNSWPTSSGGGITLRSNGAPIQGNIISNNTAYYSGGGIWTDSDSLIVNNLIIGNYSPFGAGIWWGVSDIGRGPFLINNTIAGNDVYGTGFQAQAQLINNIVATGLYCDTTYSSKPPILKSNDIFGLGGSCAGLSGSNGNISVDPLFANPAKGDYHLLVGSPAIDTGTSDQAPLTDLEGTPRPIDGNGDGIAAFDMGALEALLDTVPPVTTATLSPLPTAAGWNKTPVTVVLNATDDPYGSGVRQIQYSRSGAQGGPVRVVSGSSASFGITAEGTTTVSYFAVDNRNNVESVKSLNVNIDKTPPVISGMPGGTCKLSPPNHQLVPVATISASDALSGLASLVVTATSSQPDSGTGGGDLPGDIVINGGAVQLRAELSPNTQVRTYTIFATATDAAGNNAMATASCTVK